MMKGFNVLVVLCFCNKSFSETMFGCPEPSVPSNVAVVGRGTSHGANRVFLCPSGYADVNGESIVSSTCGFNGRWSNPPPHCTAVTVAVRDHCQSYSCEEWEKCIIVSGEARCFCKHPAECPRTNGVYQTGQTGSLICGTDGKNYESRCQLKAIACFFGKDIDIESLTPCTVFGCPEPSVPFNVAVVGRGTSHGANRVFLCPSGYADVNGESIVSSTCGFNGRWSNPPPHCTAVTVAVRDHCQSYSCEEWENCIIVSGEARCFCKHPAECPRTNGVYQTGQTGSLICGTDGKNYESRCQLKAIACFFGKDINIESLTPCTEDDSHWYPRSDFSLDYIGYSYSSGRDFSDITKPPDVTSNIHAFTELEETKCGEGIGPFAGRDGLKRIVGGTNARQEAWPWMVGLYIYYWNSGFPELKPSFFCGGSLISRDLILTAAHCFDDVDNNGYEIIPEIILVAAGSINRIKRTLSSERELKKTLQILQVVEIIKHDQYQRNSKDYDIALLRLRHKATITRSVKPVCLPEPGLHRNTDLLQTGVNSQSFSYVTGWGSREPRIPKDGRPLDLATNLQQLAMPLRSSYTCVDSLYNREFFTARMICAGYIQGEPTDVSTEVIEYTGQKDACQGDSGGPLVRARRVDGQDIYYQIGIVSWGHGCAQRDQFGFYSSLPMLVDWVSANMVEGP